MASMDTYKLVVTEWDGEDEYGDGGKPVVRDRYFGPLSEIVSRLCWPWLSGFNHAIYQRQDDGSWLLYYHSI